MKTLKKMAAAATAFCLGIACLAPGSIISPDNANAADLTADMKWEAVKIGGAGFVSGIVTGQKEMYLRTDVGGAYKYNYEINEWEQIFAFINEADRGYLSVKGIAIDPTDDNTAYFLCGCAYFSDARTVIFKTTDGGKTFTKSDVTDLIQVHGNGDGRECIEPIAIDPDNPDTIYAGGDVTAGKSALIKSTDGGKTWNSVDTYDDLGLFTTELKYPMWTNHMVRGTEDKEYNQQNGIGCILIEDGKVYVGTSVTGQANIHVASVKDDKFSVLSKDLPTANYPCTFSTDKNGNLYFTYIAGLAFSGTAGGAFKYDTATGKVTDISPTNNAFGKIEVDRENPDKLVTRTCGVWSDQWFELEWTDDSIAWGDHFYRSEDGGATWQDITPGQQAGQYTDNHYFISNPIDTNGYDWIYGKACHWGSGMMIDPRNPDRVVMTSGNGVYACDNIWDEKGIQFYFQPDGVEEVVCLDFVSVPNGENYSAIGDYDGFIHKDINEIPQQYKPNIGSTSAIAYCPSDTKVMCRVGEHEGKAYYSLDAGATWKDLKVPNGGGKMAITKLKDGSYRFIKADSGNGSLQYSDDFGGSWTKCEGLDGSKTTYPLVDLNNPAVVYGSGIKHNDYWASDPNKKEPTLEESHYSFYISTDYGATFKETVVSKYDMCDHTGDLAYLGEDNILMAVGWNGMYSITEGGTKIEKTDVFYCKTLGYGASEKEGGLNTVFMYGKPAATDAEGIYRSTDGGKTWDCINTDNLYGGTGNGNFLVGDMDEFGTVFMSTVGAGIVCGKLSDGTEPPTSKPPTSTENPTTKPTTPPDEDVVYGDANNDGTVSIADAAAILQAIGNADKYALTEIGIKNADCYEPGSGLTAADALAIQKLDAGIIKSLPEKAE
ncbi:MAG: 1,4-beta-glucanase [Ruminococcus sp.]|nr:1,4-beta-glucanase [Ruminococcus sp.]